MRVAKDFAKQVLGGATVVYLLVVERVDTDGKRSIAPTGILRVGFVPVKMEQVGHIPPQWRGVKQVLGDDDTVEERAFLLRRSYN